MFSYLKARREQRNRALKEKRYRAGYDWAAGLLLRGEQTPIYIEMMTDKRFAAGDGKEEFDRGAQDAAERLIDEGIVDNDAIDSPMFGPHSHSALRKVVEDDLRGVRHGL